MAQEGFKAFGLKVFGVSGGFGGGRSWTVEGLGFRVLVDFSGLGAFS